MNLPDGFPMARPTGWSAAQALALPGGILLEGTLAALRAEADRHRSGPESADPAEAAWLTFAGPFLAAEDSLSALTTPLSPDFSIPAPGGTSPAEPGHSMPDRFRETSRNPGRAAAPKPGAEANGNRKGTEYAPGSGMRKAGSPLSPDTTAWADLAAPIGRMFTSGSTNGDRAASRGANEGIPSGALSRPAASVESAATSSRTHRAPVAPGEARAFTRSTLSQSFESPVAGSFGAKPATAPLAAFRELLERLVPSSPVDAVSASGSMASLPASTRTEAASLPVTSVLPYGGLPAASAASATSSGSAGGGPLGRILAGLADSEANGAAPVIPDASVAPVAAPIPGMADPRAKTFPGAAKTEDPDGPPAASPAEKTLSGIRNDRVDWLDEEDDLAARLHSLLRRQARRHGVDL